MASDMKTRRIRLRDVQPDDLAVIFAWRNTERFRRLFHHSDRVVDFDTFKDEFTDDATVRPFQYMVEKIRDGHLIGLAFVHGLDEAHRECCVNIFLDERSEGKGYAVDVSALLGVFLLERIGIQRLIAEAFEYNARSIAFMRAWGLTESELIRGGRLDMEHAHVRRFVGDVALLPRMKGLLRRLSLPR